MNILLSENAIISVIVDVIIYLLFFIIGCIKTYNVEFGKTNTRVGNLL